MGGILSINAPRVVHETIDGEVIVIDLATGTYFSLQGGAADVWALIDSGHSTDQIVEVVAGARGEEPESVRSALEVFVKELEAEALVVVAPEQNGESQATPAVSVDGPFAPRLEKHTDMAELILLDPVHEVDSMGWPHRPEDAKSGG